MEILIVLDQIQAGLGGTEHGDLPLGGKKIALGAADMFDKYLNKDEKITTTLFCGDEYYMKNKNEVSLKLAAMINKLKPDAVICGPAFHYVEYAEMCAQTGAIVSEKTNIPVVAAMSKECSDVIKEYSNKVDIVKMPRKGGTGLSESLQDIIDVCRKKVNGDDLNEFKEIKIY
ncbi:proline reductase [Companilactobacillus allii]|uniref:Proline reductase n=2 Tax=Companilactobacillus allii TaxID=1847728 RepID=A0A1P8Q6E9_9LACO|nr:proline reductase [Companilactobacillus allii]